MFSLFSPFEAGLADALTALRKSAQYLSFLLRFSLYTPGRRLFYLPEAAGDSRETSGTESVQ